MVLSVADQNDENLHVISDKGADIGPASKKVYETTRGVHKKSQWAMTLFKIVNVKRKGVLEVYANQQHRSKEKRSGSEDICILIY